MRQKFVWFTDTHLNFALPWATHNLVRHLRAVNPAGIMLTGDVSNGSHLESCLGRLASSLSCPIYFVLGNHDYHGRTFASVHGDLRRLGATYSNLHWMTDRGVVALNDEVGLIGTEGWYDARLGDPSWLRYTTDWFRTFDFLALPNMRVRIDAFRSLAQSSADLLEPRLVEALDKFKTVYVLTHFPPWAEATRAVGTFMEKFWLPYNTNVVMGQMIERVMSGRNKRHAVVLAGHTHTRCWIRVSRNIECRVNKAKYYGSPSSEEHILI